jgi:leader peptidase (prepilin peptidase)/N-methyltransferase
VPVGSPDDVDDPASRPRVGARWRPPVIDLVTAAVLASLAARFGWSGQLAAVVVWGCALVPVSVIDIDHYRIPTRIVYPALGACAVLLAAAAVAASIPGALVGAGLAALAYGGFIFVFWFVYPAGMGFGDVRLAVLLGLVLGWTGAAQEIDGVLVDTGLLDAFRMFLFGGLAGSVIGSLVGVGAIVARGRRAHFPFGPSLCLGALLVVLFSEPLLG